MRNAILFIIANLWLIAQSALGAGNTVADTANHLAPSATVNQSQVIGLTAALAAKGSGTVTSVGLGLPNIFSVAGSPVTTTGTLSATLATQTANFVFAGPTNGAAAAPAFRLLAAADIPTIAQAQVTGLTASLAGKANAPTPADQQFVSVALDGTIGPSGFDDHNFILRDGTSPGMTGNLNLGTHDITNAGTVTATTFSGSGASLTTLNGSNISSGTVAAARIAALPESGVTSLVSDLALKSPLASPTFTGVPAAPTAIVGTNTTQIATTAYVLAAIPATPTIDSLLPSETGNSGKFLTTSGTAASWASITDAVRVTFDNSGTVLGASGSTVYTQVHYSGTIQSYTVLADQSGSITVTLKKCTYSGFPTTADITGGANVVLSTARKSTDATLSGWTTAVTSGDILEFAISGTPTSVTRVTVILKLARS